MKFTQKTIAAIQPRDKTYFVNSDHKNGLKIRVEPSGKKTFYFYRKAFGAPINIKIGNVADLSIENALDEVKVFNAQIARGIDPRAEKRAKKAQITFGEYFDIYMRDWSKPRKKSWQMDADQYRRHLAKPFGNVALASITRQDILKFHSGKLASSGAHSANRIKALLSSVLNQARIHGFIGESPMLGVHNHKVKDRERFLDEAEFGRFMEVVRNEKNIMLRDYLLVSLYTGARQANVLAMKWRDIDFSLHNSSWTIPASETKNGESQTIPIHGDLLKLLLNRQEQVGGGLYVFPSDSVSGHYVEPKNGWKSILSRSEIEGFRIHDLRRTFGSYLARSGVPLPLIAKALGHKNLRSTQIYARFQRQDVRNAMDSSFREHGKLFNISSLLEE